MSTPLMTSSQVESKYGIARAELLAYERAGKLSAQRTAGGHRRYSDADVSSILAERTTPANPTRKPNIDEMGVSALNKWGGTVYEEPLSELRGTRGRTLLREMHWNDPVISAVFFAIEAAMKEATWRIKPATEAQADKDAAKFIEECLGDLNLPWSDILDQIVDPMLEQGFTLMEVVYKRRKGQRPGLDADGNDLPESKYSDGKMGWYKWALRPAESLTQGNEWIFNKHGDVLGCNQTDPDTGENIVLPMTCMLHFRTTSVPANTPEGRALILDTPIPTPNGWSKINDLQIGDKVYGIDGRIRYVTWKSPVWKDRQVYKISFTDGTDITADENHLWQVTCANDRNRNKPSRKLTTLQIYEWITNHTGKNYLAISPGKTPILDAADLELPIDPYILGYWLGDGMSANGGIAVCPKDFPNFKKHAEDAGYTITYDGEIRAYVSGIKVLLGSMGLLNNKHIPQRYLRASPRQRLALLQGIMDTDGWSPTEKDKASHFGNTNKRLIDESMDLIRSLGGNPKLHIKDVPGDEGGYSEKLGRRIISRKTFYSVGFMLKERVHRLTRKADAQHTTATEKAYNHFIKSIVKLPDTSDTVCVEVDAPDHMFLAGTGMIPTHNSIHRSMFLPYYYGRNFQELEGIGAERDLQGVAVIYLGNDCNLSSDDPNSDFNLAKDLVTNLHRDEQAGVVIPRPKLGTSSEGNGMLLELLSASSSRAHDVGAIIDRYDRLKAVSVLAQFIMLGMSKSGSYALATAQSDLFTMAVAAWLRKIEDVINHTAIPRLISYNSFPGSTGNPQMIFSDVGLPNLEALSWYINALVSNNLIRPDDELEKHLRQIAHLPPPEPKSMQERSYSQIKPAESALLIRRVLLALEELPSYQGMTDEQLAALVDPLINQLRIGIENEAGISIPPATAPSVADSAKQNTPQLNTLSGPPDANAGGVAPSPAPKVAEVPSPKATAPRKVK